MACFPNTFLEGILNIAFLRNIDINTEIRNTDIEIRNIDIEIILYIRKKRLVQPKPYWLHKCCLLAFIPGKSSASPLQSPLPHSDVKE